MQVNEATCVTLTSSEQDILKSIVKSTMHTMQWSDIPLGQNEREVLQSFFEKIS